MDRSTEPGLVVQEKQVWILNLADVWQGIKTKKKVRQAHLCNL